MDAWNEFFRTFGIIAFAVVISVIVAIVLCAVGECMDKSGEVDEPEPVKARTEVYTYDRKGRIVKGE